MKIIQKLNAKLKLIKENDDEIEKRNSDADYYDNNDMDDVEPDADYENSYKTSDDYEPNEINDDEGDEKTPGYWKDPKNSNYDRQYAEDALFHTIGPLTDEPRWTNKWTSPSQPVPEFTPNGLAPKWTQEEVVMAFAGDPGMLFSGKDDPKSPRYGNKGGSPLFRTAKRVSRVYNRGTDPSFIEDMYSNGFIALMRLMQPGKDESRSPFISFAIRNVQSAMEHGVGADENVDLASGELGTYYITPEGEFRKRNNEKIPGWKEIKAVGVQGILKMTDPNAIRRAASIIKGKYQTEKSGDKNADNPFGIFSSRFYQLSMKYADALDSGTEAEIDAARQDIMKLRDDIERDKNLIGGASTGLGQAIDTPDRGASTWGKEGGVPLKVSSMNVDNDEGGSMASNIEGPGSEEDVIEQDAVNYILNMALKHDLGKILGKSEKYQRMAAELGAKNNKIGGPLSANEYRYIIRSLGQIASNYPGKGTIRAKRNIPRDSPGWLSAGEDPEIEPLPNPKIAEDLETEKQPLWHSIWSRNGYEAMGPTAIASEMGEEIIEFIHYGIKTGRTEKTGKPGTVSKVSVANALRAAQVKLKIIADIYSDRLGLKNESISTVVRQLDDIDKTIISETANTMVRIIGRVLKESNLKVKRLVSKPNNSISSTPIESKMQAVDIFTF